MIVSKTEFFKYFDEEVNEIEKKLESEKFIETVFERFYKMLTEHIKTIEGLERYKYSTIVGFILNIGKSIEECKFHKLLFLDQPSDPTNMGMEISKVIPIHEDIIDELLRSGWNLCIYAENQVYVYAKKN